MRTHPALAIRSCAVAVLGFAIARPAPAASGETLAEGLRACAVVQDTAARVECYDALAAATNVAATDTRTDAGPAPAGPGLSPLMRRWELDRSAASGEFALRPHLANYILPVTYDFQPNQQPYPPQILKVRRPEAKFQFSFKLKLLEDIGRGGGDVWLNYTQQSWWQVYNGEQSAPFRETNYRPGLSWVVPADFSIAGLKGRAVSLTVEHQSNGRTSGLSRSWNRVAATAVLERGNFAAIVSAWVPFDHREDNPRITRYFGYGDVQLGWRAGRSTVSALIRNPLGVDSGRMGVELGWSFPLPFTDRVRGFAQYYHGYGESLIDHDARANRIGIGISLSDWL